MGPGAHFWRQFYPTYPWRTMPRCATGKRGSHVHHFWREFYPTYPWRRALPCATDRKYWWRSHTRCATAKPGCTFLLFGCHHHHPFSPLFLSSSSYPPLNSRSARPLPLPTSFSSLSSHILPHKSTYFLHVYVRKHLPHLVLDRPPPGALSFDVFVGR